MEAKKGLHNRAVPLKLFQHFAFQVACDIRLFLLLFQLIFCIAFFHNRLWQMPIRFGLTAVFPVPIQASAVFFLLSLIIPFKNVILSEAKNLILSTVSPERQLSFKYQNGLVAQMVTSGINPLSSIFSAETIV